MAFYYFDANPLLRWAETQALGADKRCITIAGEVSRLITNSDNTNAISEVTIIEYQSNLFNWYRNSEKPQFDLGKAHYCFNQLMVWIDQGRIEVLELPSKWAERALAYIRTAAMEQAGSLRSWDAAHLFQACDWAKETRALVNIVTNDPVFRKFIKVFPEFAAHVRIYDPATKKTYPR
jgi:hypothetical protein